MENAKEELLEHIGTLEVKYISIVFNDGCCKETERRIAGDLDTVSEWLNFEYDNGYGRQEIDGTIWYEDGTWSDRREYDGSEWWEHHVCPEIKT